MTSIPAETDNGGRNTEGIAAAASIFEAEPNITRYALISVSDKTGIGVLAHALDRQGYRIISTGGTARTLAGQGIPVVPVEDITGNPEALDGRMKTISWQIEGGLLVDRRKPSHVAEAHALHLPRIDIVVCNLYPFAETVKKADVTLDEAVEQIDVGGPTMIRAAAKNFANVLVVVDTRDYERVADMLTEGAVPLETRKSLAAKAFAHLAYYDAQVARFLGRETFPAELTLPLTKSAVLRYGDNPDQQAAVYLAAGVESPLRNLRRHAGRELSATNVTDVDAGLQAVLLFEEPAAVVIKHNSPCGIALGKTIEEALARALESDPESAFGGVVVMNKPMTTDASRAIAAFKEQGRGNMDIVAMPAIESDSLQLLTSVRKTTGVYTFGSLEGYIPDTVSRRMVWGGAVVQTANNPEHSFASWTVVTRSQPSEAQLQQMRVGWKFASRIRSNTVIVIDGTYPITRGIGSGQTSRVLSTKIALERAGSYARGGILVSDSFFPFDDSVKLAISHGIAAVVQQGGSVNDAMSIKAADDAGIPMVFTHQRLFWH